MTTMTCPVGDGCRPALPIYIEPVYATNSYWVTDNVMLGIAALLLVAAVVVVFRRDVRYRARWLLLIALFSLADLVGIGYELDREVQLIQAIKPCSTPVCSGADSQAFNYRADTQ